MAVARGGLEGQVKWAKGVKTHTLAVVRVQRRRRNVQRGHHRVPRVDQPSSQAKCSVVTVTILTILTVIVLQRVQYQTGVIHLKLT